MTITVEISKKDFLESSIKAFKNKSLNDARQSAESFCKLVILKEHGEIEGNEIIDGKNLIIKSFDLNMAIESILFKNKIKNGELIHKKVKSYLQVLQNHGNLGSHNDHYSRLDLTEIEYGLYHLTRLVKFLYDEYLKEDIPNDLENLLNYNDNEIKTKIISTNKDWCKINDLTNDFSELQQKYILISDKCDNNPILSNLSTIKWSYIGDFDNKSNEEGLYYNLNSELSQFRDINLITLNNSNSLSYSKSTLFWDFLNGYTLDTNTMVDGFRDWQKKYIYSNQLKKHIDSLYNSGFSTSDTFIFIFWEDISILRYLFEYLNILDNVFKDSINLIFLSTNEQIRKEISEEVKEYDNFKNYSNIYDLSIEKFSILLKNRTITNLEDIILPALIQGIESTTKIEHSKYLKYQDDVKIFNCNYESDVIDCENYYKGNLINFDNLNNDCDVERDIGKELEEKILDKLKNRNNQLFYLLTEPNAGVTTISYRILWNLREYYPSFELLNYKKQNTFEFFQNIYSNTNKPILIFIDYKIPEEHVKNLVTELNTKRITYVIMYVNRFLKISDAKNYKIELEKSPTKLPFIVSEHLSRKENENFYKKFVRSYPDKSKSLIPLKNSGHHTITPFKYLFTIFLDEYSNLDNYIKYKIDELNDFQTRRTKFLALIQYYTGLDTSIKFLTGKIAKYSLYEKENKINSLILYSEINDELIVEFIHNLVCEKILQLISGVNLQKAWKQKLADIGIDFLDFIENEHLNQKESYIVKDILNRLFIKRNITTYDTENVNKVKYYTDFIEDLNATNSPIDSKERIFTRLTELYPSDRHYWAHLGRFYSVDRINLEKALDCIDKAIEIANEEGNSDSILYHMKGMVYFRWIKNLVKEKEDINKIIKYGKLASNFFILSRENDTQINNEYPFVSHGQMLLTILEYGKTKYDDNIYVFMNNFRNDDFVANIVDNIENLISDFEVIRSKSDDFSDMNNIKISLSALQGDISKSLETLNNLLDKNTHYNPVLRRNIVRLNLSKVKENIDLISKKQITTLIGHLEKNLDTFSLEDSNSTDILLWLRLIRHKDINYDMLKIIDILTYIKTILGEERYLTKVQKNTQIIILYYLQIMKFIQYKNGDNNVFSEFIEIKKQLKNKVMYLDGKSLAREWLHSVENNNLKKVINWYDKRLIWINEDKFFDSDSEQHLELCRGIIKEIQSQKTGFILYKNIPVHFIPRTDFTTSDLNKEVEFYLSFSYDEMSAWKVKKV